MLTYPGREDIENTLDFPLLSHLLFPPAIVQLHHIEWLDEEGLPAGRRVVDQAADQATCISPHRQHVSSVPNRDDVFLQSRAVPAAGDETVEPVHQPMVGCPHCLANAGEFIAGAVEYIPTRTDRSGQVRFERREVLDRLRELEQVGIALGGIRHPGEHAPDFAPRPQRIGYLQQLVRGEPATFLCLENRGPDIPRSTNGEFGKANPELGRFGGDIQHGAHDLAIAARTELQSANGSQAVLTIG